MALLIAIKHSGKKSYANLVSLYLGKVNSSISRINFLGCSEYLVCSNSSMPVYGKYNVYRSGLGFYRACDSEVQFG